MLRLSKAAPPASTKGPGPEDPVGPERAVGQIVYQTLRRVVKDVPAAVLETLDAGRIMAAVDWQDVGERLMEIAPPLQRVITTAAREEIPSNELAKAVALPEAGTEISFALIDRLAVEYADAHAGTLVMEISDKMRETIRQVTTGVVAGQLPRDGVVRLLRATLPLHSQWADTVSKVYAREYAAQIEAGANLTRASDRAARVADIRAQRLLQARSKNIARTEVMRAQNEGKFAGWSQRVAEGWMPVDSVKEWVEGRDPCSRCAPLVGKIVPWDQPFPNGQMMPPEHPSCRCTAILLPPDDEFLEIMERQQAALSLAPTSSRISLQSLPADTKVAREALDNALAGRDFAGFTVKTSEIIRDNVEFEILAPNGAHAGYARRRLLGNGVIEHDEMRLKPEYRGQGFSRAFGQHMEDWYRESGIDTIVLRAGLDDGGYAWAKAGYDWDPRPGGRIERLIEHIQTQRAGLTYSRIAANPALEAADIWLYELEQKVTDVALAVNTGMDPTAAYAAMPKPWEIANASYPGMEDLGKQLLRGTDWYGRKAL